MIVITFSQKAHNKSLCNSFGIKSCLGNAILCTDKFALGVLYLLTSAACLMFINTEHQMHLLHTEQISNYTFVSPSVTSQIQLYQLKSVNISVY